MEFGYTRNEHTKNVLFLFFCAGGTEQAIIHHVAFKLCGRSYVFGSYLASVVEIVIFSSDKFWDC